MKYTIIVLVLLISTTSTFSQQTGEISYPNLGLKFSVPDGWLGQESEIGFVMGSNTIAGLALVMTNEVKTLDDMRNEAAIGIVDENGTSLKPSGSLTIIGQNAIGGIFEGTLEWQPARAYVIGMVNPQGYGITIVTVTSSSAYSSVHEEVSKSIARSTVFSKIEFVDQSGQWKESLSNARLTYMNSNYSTDINSDGSLGGSGYSDKVIIDLCGQGHFNYSSNSTSSFDTTGGSLYGTGGDQGAGSWEVVNNPIGQPILRLNFRNGEVSEFLLELIDSKTYLNGSRYFRTYGNYRDDGPDCQ